MNSLALFRFPLKEGHVPRRLLLTTVDFNRGVVSRLTSKTGLRCAGKFSDFPGIK
jgi:hypothetical protein